MRYYGYVWIWNVVSMDRGNMVCSDTEMLETCFDHQLRFYGPSTDRLSCTDGNIFHVMNHAWYYSVYQVLEQAAEGMNYLHQCNPPVIHRDLRSQYIQVPIVESFYIYASDRVPMLLFV